MSVSIPGLLDVANTVTDTIKGTIEGTMVYPTHLVIPLADNETLSTMELTRPPPQGVLRFQIIEAKDLPRMDSGTIPGVSSRTSSDPYVRARCGFDKSTIFKTEVLQKNLNPGKLEFNSSMLKYFTITPITFSLSIDLQYGLSQQAHSTA